MKTLIAIIVILCISMIAKSQDLPMEGGKVIYKYDVIASGKSKQDLYKISKDFINDVLVKNGFVFQDDNSDTGVILGRGISAFTKKDSKGFMWSVGKANRPKFNISFSANDGYSVIQIDNIKMYRMIDEVEISKPIEEDMMEEKEAIQNFTVNKYKGDRIKRYEDKADMINNHFYSIIALYKRFVDSKVNK